jgi:hypothetical protein
MLQYLTGADLFAQAMMIRGVDKRLVLMLESPADCNIIDPHLASKNVHSIPGNGKASVLEACTLATQHNVGEIFGVADRDLDDFSSTPSPIRANVTFTEFYDLDMDVIMANTDIVARIIHSYGDRDRLASYLNSLGDSDIQPLDVVLRLAMPVGILRLVSLLEGLELKLSKFPCDQLLDAVEAGEELQEAARITVLRTSTSLDQAYLIDLIDRRAIESHVLLVNGHDFANSLSGLIRKRWGGMIGADSAARTIRATASCATWEKVKCFKVLAGWAASLGRAMWNCPAA